MSDHDHCRKKVCVVCIGKATYPREITSKQIELVRLYVRHDFSIDDHAYPCGLCARCHHNLYQKAREPESILLVEPFTADRTRQLRSSVCVCRICEVAKSDFNASRKLKKKRGRPTQAPPSSLNSSMMCKICLTELYQGCRHDCSKKTKLENLEKQLASLTKKTSSKLVQRVVKKGEEFTATKRTSDSNHAEQISGEHLSQISKNMNLSLRQTKELARNIRSATGSRTIVEKKARDKVHDDRHILDDHFVYENLLFVEEDSKKKTKRKFFEHAVVCKDTNHLIDEIIRFRDIQGSDVMIRVGLDGGGGFLKICLSVFDINSPISQLSKVAKKFKDSGVKKVLTIAISPELPENYYNVKKLWIEAGVHRLRYPFTIATDMKLVNILLGMQNHSSLHPCPWCDVTKYELHKKGTSRTFSSLIKLFLDYDDANVGKDHAKEYGNVIHVPIVDVEDQDTPVIHKVPPPELHLLLGPTNHIIDELCKLWPGCIVWLQSLNLSRVEYFGGSYEGNECRKILKKIESLEAICPPEYHQFVTTLKLFNEVVKSCYGYELSDDFIEKIHEFKVSYLKLNISVTPKVHAIFVHIAEFCLFAGRGLGPYSEQTAESLHSEFKKCWGNFFVKDTDNPAYPDRLLSAVQTFNSMHL